ncbi:unnamed protein product [Paramecium sonneborni]|uniref:Protein kinase domain-containing protein n=1 Tax=Paramecium sonneborni TaxID=65129 RepID=A0A8S1N7P2_9CILI|nr:unnamed protein product [Paramecium sonneborni]
MKTYLLKINIIDHIYQKNHFLSTKNLMDYIDYTEIRFQFIGVRKHFFSDKQYYVSVFDDCFVMGATPHTQQPKYTIKFGFSTKIRWNIKKTKQGLLFDSFSFPYKQEMKVMSANHDNLIKFKEMISLKVTFDNINDLYEPLSLIGKGISAKVYSASQKLDQKIYAIKAIEKAFLKQQNESGQAAFKMEVSILKTLAKFPENFLTLKEIYEGDQVHCLVTSFLEGSSLTQEFDRLKTSDMFRFPIHQTKLIMKKLLTNLAVLHQNKIIHRDLKPDNLMFSKKNDYSTLVLVDFGLATSESMEKFLFPKCGTPGYVAPEILTLKPFSRYTTKVDIFSCGCIFYKLLTGKNLFGGISFDETLKQNRMCQIEFNLQFDQQYITEQSINLLQQMLMINPKHRITAKDALYHPFFDQNLEQNIFQQALIFSPKRSTKIFLNAKQEEQQSDLDSFQDDKISNEKQIEESNFIQLPKSKRCSLMGDFSLLSQSPCKFLHDTQQFYQKDPLSGFRCIKVTQSPQVSQILD